MSREDYYFNDNQLKIIRKIKTYIEQEKCWQINLIDIKEFTKLSREYRISDFKEKDIIKFWQLGFINADIVYSTRKLNNDNLIFLFECENYYFYSDERFLEERPNGYTDSFSELDDIEEDINLLFHPFRLYLLYHLNRILFFRPSLTQVLLNADGFEKATSIQIESFNNLTSKPETIKLFQYWNHLSSLCVISESSTHSIIHNELSWNLLNGDQEIIKKLDTLANNLKDLFKIIGEEALEFYRQEICSAAEFKDPNKNLHLIIRLMNTSSRKQLKGHIAAAILFKNMAESLRRILESVYEKQYVEEDELGFGTVFQETKLKVQGSTRILDDRLAANQFLRRFGLDYGIRVNIYVEGDTEFGFLEEKFKDNTSVLVINLKGKVAERGGKGFAFRDSLRNDIKSKTFSLILFDGDRSDFFRAAKKAAEEDEICGMFFVSTPDFEIQNLTPKELAKIAYEFGNEKDIVNLELNNIEDTIQNIKSSEEYFEELNKLDSTFSYMKKNEGWGRKLLSFVLENPRDVEFGSDEDRLINQVVSITYQCCTYMYEPTRQGSRVDPETGKLVKRESLETN